MLYRKATQPFFISLNNRIKIRGCVALCLVLLVIVLHTPFLWANFEYDMDRDCDFDGEDLFKLISAGDFSVDSVLPELATKFGLEGSCCVQIGIGTPLNGYPSWRERTMIVFTNMVRMAPAEYRDAYMTDFEFPEDGILNLYSAVAPVYWNHELNRAARFHAEDLAFNCRTLQHNSCDGTIWYERIGRFYPYSVTLGENIAYGFATPWGAINALVCDRYGSTCAPDSTGHSGYDGHRQNIMRAQYNEIGSGFAKESRGYWVQDFGGRNIGIQPPVASATHAFLENGVTSFLLNYFDSTGAAPESILVVLDDIEYSLDLDTGSKAAGSYRVDVVSKSSCRPYFFLATASDGICYRYPGTSNFYTFGEGDCVLDYNADFQ